MRILFFYIILFFSSWSFTQDVLIVVNPEKTEIGKAVEVTFSYRNKLTKDIHFPSTYQIQENIRNVVENGRLDMDLLFTDTTYQQDDYFIWERQFTLTPWDTGIYYIKDQFIEVDNKKVSFPNAILNIQNNDLANDAPYALKEDFAQLELDTNNSVLIKLFFISLSIITSFLIWKFLSLKKKKNETLANAEDLFIIPIDKAKLELKRLRILELWKNEKTIEHYSQLSLIIKQYLGEEFNENYHEKTTTDLITFLAIKNISPKLALKIKQLLDETDQVKFGSTERSEEKHKDILLRTEFVLMEIEQEINKIKGNV